MNTKQQLQTELELAYRAHRRAGEGDNWITEGPVVIARIHAAKQAIKDLEN